MLSRRGLIVGMAGLILAPAVVKASSIMPIKVPKIIAPEWEVWCLRLSDKGEVTWYRPQIRDATKEENALLNATNSLGQWLMNTKDATFVKKGVVQVLPPWKPGYEVALAT